jgi:hypothetical protein
MSYEQIQLSSVAPTVSSAVDARLATPLPVASPDSVGFSADRLNRAA